MRPVLWFIAFGFSALTGWSQVVLPEPPDTTDFNRGRR